MAGETDAVAATGTIYSSSSAAPIPLSSLFKYYGLSSGHYIPNSSIVKYFSVGIHTDDGSYLLGPDGIQYYFGNAALDIPISEFDEFYFVPSGVSSEATLIHFNAETSDTSYSRPPTSVVLGTGTIRGLDYARSLDDPSMISAIQNAGYGFVIRYYSTDGSETPLSASEIADLSPNLEICTIWENKSEQSGSNPLSDGAADARNAIDQAISAGQTEGSAIYFAIDGNFSSALIQNYFSQVSSVFADAAINKLGYSFGVYGSDQACGDGKLEGASYAWDWTNTGHYN